MSSLSPLLETFWQLSQDIQKKTGIEEDIAQMQFQISHLSDLFYQLDPEKHIQSKYYQFLAFNSWEIEMIQCLFSAAMMNLQDNQSFDIQDFTKQYYAIVPEEKHGKTLGKIRNAYMQVGNFIPVCNSIKNEP